MNARYFWLGMCALLALLGCTAEKPFPNTYENQAFGVSFIPQPGWVVKELPPSADCQLAVEAAKEPDCRLQLCISSPRQEILFTRNTFVSCENLKQYITQALKGLNPSCNKGAAGNLFAFDTLYERRIQSGAGLRYQFVNHLFAPAKGKLVQVMAYTLGDTEAQARQRFQDNQREIGHMMNSVRVR